MLDMQLNKKLLPMKGHYFLWNAGTAPVVPFLSTYARQLGFSSFIVGIMYTVMPFMGMIAKPIFGAIADRYRCQKKIFLAFILVTAIAFLGIYYVPDMPIESKIRFDCDSSVTELNTCVNNFTVSQCAAEQIKNEIGENTTVHCDLNCPLEDGLLESVCNVWNISCSVKPEHFKFTTVMETYHTETLGDCVYFRVKHVLYDGQYINPVCIDRISTVCNMNCDYYAINDLIAQPQVGDDIVYTKYEFWIFFLLMVISWIGQAIVVSVSDAACFELLENRPEKYGVQRSFGALGWGLFSVLAGLMIDTFSDSEKKNYVSVFYLALAMLLLDFLVSYQITYTQKKISSNILRDVGLLLTNFRIIVFMLFCIFVGMCTGLIWQFLFWLLEDLAAAQGCESQEWIKTLQGIVMAIQCLLGELPFFFLSGWILKRIGHVNAMSLVLLVIGIRYILYSVISNPWWFLPIELTNGLTFGLYYASMASYASIVAPPGTETTVQGVVGAVFEGIGVSMGSLIGGALYSKYGGIITFRIFGIASLIACLLHALIQFFMDRLSNGKDTLARYAAPLDAISMIGDEGNFIEQ